MKVNGTPTPAATENLAHYTPRALGYVVIDSQGKIYAQTLAQHPAQAEQMLREACSVEIMILPAHVTFSIHAAVALEREQKPLVPPDIVERYRPAFPGLRFLGHPCSNMSRDDLLTALAWAFETMEQGKFL